MSRQTEFQFQLLRMSKDFSGAIYISLEQAYHRVITAFNMEFARKVPFYKEINFDRSLVKVTNTHYILQLITLTVTLCNYIHTDNHSAFFLRIKTSISIFLVLRNRTKNSTFTEKVGHIKDANSENSAQK